MPHSVNSSKEIDTGIDCLLLLAHFYGLPGEPNQLQHEFGASLADVFSDFLSGRYARQGGQHRL